MSFKTTAVLLIILSFIAAYFYFYEHKYLSEKKEIEEQQKKFIDLEKEQVGSITLENIDKNLTIRLVKDKDEWRIVEPIPAPADEVAADGLVSTLVTAKRERIVTDSPKDLVVFGLHPPKIRVTVGSNDGKITRTIELGNTNPTKAYRYARMHEKPTVMLAQNRLFTTANKELFDLRDKKILSLDLYEVNRLTIEAKDKPRIVIEHPSGDVWKLVEPKNAPGDHKEIEKLINSINNSRITAFIEEKAEEFEKYGLDKPQLKVSFLVGEDNAQKTLIIGNRVDDETKEEYYATRGQSRQVFRVRKSLYDDLNKQPIDLRERSVLKFARESVARLIIKRNDEIIEAVKDEDEGKWSLAKPFEDKGDDAFINSMLATLSMMKVKEYIDEDAPRLAKYGLDKPWYTLTVQQTFPRDQIHQLFVGDLVRGEEAYYATNSDINAVFSIANKDFKGINKSLFDLRNKMLMNFSREDLESIEIELPDTNMVFERKGDDWYLVEPEKFKVPRAKMDKIIWATDYVKMEEIISEPAGDLSRYGLDSPRAKITVRLKDDKVLGPLLIGDDHENRTVLVKIADRDLVASVQDTIIKDMPKNIDEIKD